MLLPNVQWLNDNGDGGMVYAMKKRPELFTHIPQEKCYKSPKEWVSIAERLAEKYGILPGPSWLRNNGYSGLDQCMQNRPELFSHITQERCRKPKKKVKQHVADAEKLAKEHGGVLPAPQWLRNNGHSGMYRAMQKRPELFAHILHQKRFKAPEEHVADAEKLAKECKGVLPHRKWLIKNGHSGMYQTMQKRPKLFAHIPQEKKYKTPEEHVVDAEQLAKEHGGVLPNRMWLKKNSYSGLDAAMKRHPEAFKHIKQKRLQ